MHHVPVRGYAASELDLLAEMSTEGGEACPLSTSWDGRCVTARNAGHAETLAGITRDVANGIDSDLYAGRFEGCDRTKATHRAARDGLWRLAGRLMRCV